MSLRQLSMILGACGAMLAQSEAAGPAAPPPGLEEALRERVKPFYQAHVDEKYRKAYDVVADDSKDAFLTVKKPHYDGFEIQKIAFSDDFTKAVVTTQFRTTMLLLGFSAPEANFEDSNWKLVDGQWYWYAPPAAPGETQYTPAQIAVMQRLNITPPGGKMPGAQAPAGNGTEATGGIPASAFPPGMMQGMPMAPAPGGGSTAAASLLKQLRGQVHLDKASVKFRTKEGGKASIVVKNTSASVVRVALLGAQVPGLNVTLDKSEIPGGGSAAVSIEWSPAGAGIEPHSVPYRVSVNPQHTTIPFNIVFE